MDNEQLRTLARLGAQARLQAIEQERRALLAAFPPSGRTTSAKRQQPASQPRAARKRRSMTAAERKAVGARMTAYWAKRRAEKAGADTGATAGTKTARTGRKGSKAR